MLKIVATTALMVAGGIGTYAVALSILKYYGMYPALSLGAAAIGFLAPGVTVWYLDMRGYKNASNIFLGTLALMVLGGIGTCAVLVSTAMIWGSRLHGNYMYYDFGTEISVLTAIAFCAPGVVVWCLGMRGYKNACTIFLPTLAVMMGCGFYVHVVMLVIAGSVGKYVGTGMFCGLLALGPIGFLAPGVVVWYRHKKRTRKEHSR